MDILKTENQELKNVLKDILTQAESNHRSLLHLRQLEIEWLIQEDFGKLVTALTSETRKHMQLDAVSFHLFDPEHVVADIVKLTNTTLPDDFTLVQEYEFLKSLYGKRVNATLVNKNPELARALFPAKYNTTQPTDKPISSIACLPLRRQKTIIGTLNLGSVNPRRFHENMATDFLDHLATVAGVCVENSLNREQLKIMSLIDPLTGVKNRRCFEQSIKLELDRARRARQDVSCLFLDIDHFKSINDQFGHDIGDKALRTIAKRIEKALRQIDICCRYGGEEFVVILPNTNMQSALEIAERLRVSVKQDKIYHKMGDPLTITTSIGVSTWPKQLWTDPKHGFMSLKKPLTNSLVMTLSKHADEAVYAAKDAGRDRVYFKPLFSQESPMPYPTDNTIDGVSLKSSNHGVCADAEVPEKSQ